MNEATSGERTLTPSLIIPDAAEKSTGCNSSAEIFSAAPARPDVAHPDLTPGGFSRFPDSVRERLKELGLKAVDLAVGLAVLGHYRPTDKTTEVWPHMTTLAAEINTSDDTVSRSLVRWDATGLLPRRRIRKKSGRRGQYAYDVGRLLALMPGRRGAGAAPGPGRPPVDRPRPSPQSGPESPPPAPDQAAKRGVDATRTRPQNAASLTQTAPLVTKNHLNNNTQAASLPAESVVVFESLRALGVDPKVARRLVAADVEACKREIRALPQRHPHYPAGKVVAAIQSAIAGHPWSLPMPSAADEQAARAADEARSLPVMAEVDIEASRARYHALPPDTQKKIRSDASAALRGTCPTIWGLPVDHPTHQRAFLVLMSVETAGYVARPSAPLEPPVAPPEAPPVAPESPPQKAAPPAWRTARTPAPRSRRAELESEWPTLVEAERCLWHVKAREEGATPEQAPQRAVDGRARTLWVEARLAEGLEA